MSDEESADMERTRQSALRLLTEISDILSSNTIADSQSSQSNLRTESNSFTYDSSLPSRHEYLGLDLEELRGRTLHDEGSIISLPIIPEISVILVPGQVLPLTVFYPPTIAMLQNIISKDRTFGVVCVQPTQRLSRSSGSTLSEYGTTAEIFQYQEQSDPVLAGFKIKARGRQRFKLLELLPGTRSLLAKVLILPEVALPSSLHAPRILSLDRHRMNKSGKYRLAKRDAVFTPWPDWVHFLYDPETLAKKFTEELLLSNLDVPKVLPTDPVGLSFWATQSLLLNDGDRIKMLSFNSAIERLQYAIHLLQKCQKLYCRDCRNEIGDRKDVFSMSIEGPQGVYCNPDGHVHDTITLYTVSGGIKLARDRPSTNYSWFPGYAWTIASCEICGSHLGWCFTATNSLLKPAKFWGLTKRSLLTD